MEAIRSIKVRVEVDTNKDTYVLDEDDLGSLAEVKALVASWVDRFEL